MQELIRSVARAIKRLERSVTPLKRRNARLAFSRALRELQKAVDMEWRPMRNDGTEVEKTRVKGRVCPHCKVPFRGLRRMLTHLQRNHGWSYFSKCGCCGKSFPSDDKLIKHLAGSGDLELHLARSNLKKAAEVHV